MSWNKLEPLKGGIVGCANCGYKPDYIKMDMRIAVGFGAAELKKDGETIWAEDGRDYDECITAADAEEIAATDPDHDWRIWLFAPLSEVEYQRHEAGKWALVSKGGGFA